MTAAQSAAEQASQQVRVRDSETIDAVLTISGGISLGSYQAGVNWMLLEVFKRTATETFRRQWNLPRYELKAMAGASAGNINGFLTAVEWCRAREPTPAEASLFWRIWIQTGIDQLFPPRGADRDETDQGLLSRQYFDRVHFPALEEGMRNIPRDDGLLGCTVPIGVTVTRIRPGRIQVTEDLYAPTQRFAAVAQVSRRDPSALQFLAPPPEIRRTRKLGALLLLPQQSDGVIRPRHIFSLIQASSAFPGAFAPVLLTYTDPTASGCGMAGGGCPDTAVFSDGGLFDNNPIDLAVGIYNEAIWRDSSQANPDAQIIYISPDQLRGRYLTASDSIARERPPPAEGGISALLELVGGAVPSARQYELHTFARLLERAPSVFRRENIKVTNRAFPVTGEQLGAFAAFLGKPFREFDFYVGAYDALAFFAREACETGSGVDTTCVVEGLGRLVESDEWRFGNPGAQRVDEAIHPGRRTVQRLYAWEHLGADPDSTFAFRPTAPPREIFSLALLRANARIAGGFDNQQCDWDDAIEALLCLDGFGRVLNDFANDTVLQAIDRTIAQQPREECDRTHWVTSPPVCEADVSFRDFVRGPERFMASLVGQMLHRLWRVEQNRKESGRKDWAGVATVSEGIFQSTVGYRYRRGVEINTSSVPRGADGSWLPPLMPNYMSLNLGARGFEIGYRPTVHLSNTLALGATVAPLHLITDAADPLNTFRWAIGPIIHWKRADAIWSGLEFGVELFGRWRRSPFGDEADRVGSVAATIYFFADKIRISGRLIPGNHSEINDGTFFTANIGLSDVNGLLYWAIRSLGAF